MSYLAAANRPWYLWSAIWSITMLGFAPCLAEGARVMTAASEITLSYLQSCLHVFTWAAVVAHIKNIRRGEAEPLTWTFPSTLALETRCGSATACARTRPSRKPPHPEPHPSRDRCMAWALWIWENRRHQESPKQIQQMSRRWLQNDLKELSPVIRVT